MISAIESSGFTFSDTPTEDTTLREYWYPRITGKDVIDNDMLRELMIRIYDYLTGGAQA